MPGSLRRYRESLDRLARVTEVQEDTICVESSTLPGCGIRVGLLHPPDAVGEVMLRIIKPGDLYISCSGRKSLNVRLKILVGIFRMNRLPCFKSKGLPDLLDEHGLLFQAYQVTFDGAGVDIIVRIKTE